MRTSFPQTDDSREDNRPFTMLDRDTIHETIGFDEIEDGEEEGSK
jgi:hypothetical protein